MARLCVTCSLPRDQREQITAALADAVDGTRPRSIASIAREAGVGEHALHRHVRAGHEARGLPGVVVVPEVEDVQIGNLAARLLGLADNAAAVRRQAALDGHRGDVLKAVEVESRTLGVLLSRIGLTETSSVELLREAGLLARAVGAACRTSSETATSVLLALEAIGASTTAEDLRRSIDA